MTIQSGHLLLALAFILLVSPAMAQDNRQEVIEIQLVHADDEINLQNGYVTKRAYQQKTTANIGQYRYHIIDANGTTKRIGSFSFNRQITVEGQGQTNATGVTTTLTIPYDTSYDKAIIYKNGVQKISFDLPHPTRPDNVYVAMSGQSAVSGSSSIWPIVIGIVILLFAAIILLSITKP